MSEEQIVQAAARLIMRAVLNAIQSDPHQWSTRPCATCRLVSGVLGEPFGCDLYRAQNPRKP